MHFQQIIAGGWNEVEIPVLETLTFGFVGPDGEVFGEEGVDAADSESIKRVDEVELKSWSSRGQGDGSWRIRNINALCFYIVLALNEGECGLG